MSAAASTDPSNIVVYGFVRDDMGSHYSNDDFWQYNKYIEGKLGVTIENVGLNENIYTNFGQFISKIEAEFRSGKKIFFIFIADVFFSPCKKIKDFAYSVDYTDEEQLVVDRWKMHGSPPKKTITVYRRDSAYSPKTLMGRLRELQKYGTIIPEVDFMYTTGSKYYVADPDFGQLMLRPTLTFPTQTELIQELPDDKYILKKGFVSSSYGNFFYEGPGNKIPDAIKMINTGGMRDIDPDYHEFQEKYETEGFKLLLSDYTYGRLTICDDYTIVQKVSDLYKKCHEFKFGILNDKIICVVSDKRFETINYEDEINPHILKFVREVIALIKRKWPNYLYVRIDIMVVCNPDDKDAILYDKGTGSIPTIAPVIYLNEIEPLGSGLKGMCNNIEDDKIKRPIDTSAYTINLYGDERVELQISAELVKLIQSESIGGGKKYRLVKNIN